MLPAIKIFVCFFPYVVRNYTLFTNTLRYSRTVGSFDINQVPCSKEEFNAFFAAKVNIFVGFNLRKPVKYL